MIPIWMQRRVFCFGPSTEPTLRRAQPNKIQRRSRPCIRGAPAAYLLSQGLARQRGMREIGLRTSRASSGGSAPRCSGSVDGLACVLLCGLAKQKKEDCRVVLLEARLPYKEPALLFAQAFGSIRTQTSANERSGNVAVRHGRPFVNTRERLLVAGGASTRCARGMRARTLHLSKASRRPSGAARLSKRSIRRISQPLAPTRRWA